MKFLFGEFPADYGEYHFPYQVWLVKEEGDEVSGIYEMGFLQFRSKENLYYLCRSVRVNLDQFELSSENRRILRKTEKFDYQLVRLDKFEYAPLIQKSCKDWFNQKFGGGKISAAAIRKIFTAGIFTHIFVWHFDKKIVGYAIVYINESLVHYAHVFYNPALSKENLGARMILAAVLWAKENRKRYIYLGTCYSRAALYKTEFTGVEFFDGFCWSDNLEELKYLIDRKSENYLLRDKDFRGRFYSRGFKEILNPK